MDENVNDKDHSLDQHGIIHGLKLRIALHQVPEGSEVNPCLSSYGSAHSVRETFAS